MCRCNESSLNSVSDHFQLVGIFIRAKARINFWNFVWSFDSIYRSDPTHIHSIWRYPKYSKYFQCVVYFWFFRLVHDWSEFFAKLAQILLRYFQTYSFICSRKNSFFRFLKFKDIFSRVSKIFFFFGRGWEKK